MAINDLINKAKSFARKNPDKAKSVLEKIETTVDEKTQGKYRDKVTKAGDAVGGALGVERDKDQGQVGGETPAAESKPAADAEATPAAETESSATPEADGPSEPKNQ